MSLHTTLQPYIGFLRQHPILGQVLAFLLAFVESIPLIGTFIPGSLTMTALGALIGAAVLPAYITLSLIAIGAIAGDCASFFVGQSFKHRLRQYWPFTRHPEWLIQGEAFTRKHGGKSIAIGRFLGPVRSLTPIVSGMLSLPWAPFLLAAIPAACLWAIIYPLPGMLLGALSLELPPKLATELMLYTLGLLVAVWLTVWLLHVGLAKLDLWTNRLARLITRRWQYQPRFLWLKRLLYHEKRHKDHRQIWLLMFGLTCLTLLGILTENVLTQTGLVHLNQPIFHLARSFHSELANQVMLTLTLLGEHSVLIPTVLLTAGWAFSQGHRRTAKHMLALLGLTLGLSWLMKQAIASPRPGHLSFLHNSFPSGHTTGIVSTLGLFTILVNAGSPQARRKPIYAMALGLITLVALSRLYLGAHWLTDVLAGLCLGSLCVTVTVISYRRKPTAPLPNLMLALVFGSCLLSFTLIHGMLNFDKLRNYYIPYSPLVILDQHAWWAGHETGLPDYRRNRFGHNVEPLTLQWQGALPTIQKQLTTLGWQPHTTQVGWQGFLRRLGSQQTLAQLPLLPHRVNDHAPALIMSLPQDKQTLMLRLWRTDAHFISRPTAQLWIGTVQVQRAKHADYTARPAPRGKPPTDDKRRTQLTLLRQQLLSLHPPLQARLAHDGPILRIIS